MNKQRFCCVLQAEFEANDLDEAYALLIEHFSGAFNETPSWQQPRLEIEFAVYSKANVH